MSGCTEDIFMWHFSLDLFFFVNNKPKWKIYTKPIDFLPEEIER